jgi:hypothetical protein
MQRTTLFGLLLVLASFGTPTRSYAAKVTHSISYADSRSLATTLWYPDGVTTLRGVIVFTGGASGGGSGDTRYIADNRFWQRFGQSLGFAIVGTQFTGMYTDASNGPGQALLDTLQAYADDTSHPELANAPLLLEGFSNGGYFSFTFAHWKPERTIAFCLNKSGFAQASLDAAFLAVPGFLIWGSDEPNAGVPTVIHALVQKGRAQHALWAELREWGAEHEEGSAERVFAPFFAEMIAARYPAGKSPKDGPVALIALNETDGWLADHSDDSVSANVPTSTAWDDYKADKTAASWLPSEGLAYLWRGFVTKNPLNLTAPAAAAQLDAAQAVALAVSGVEAADEVSFADGAMLLAEHVKPSSGESKASWMPEWGGPRGFVAFATSGTGTLTHFSRPAHVVLYGKDPPVVMNVPEPMVDAGLAADSGMPDAGTPRAGAGGAAGAGRAGAGGSESKPDAGSSSSSTDAASPDVETEANAADAHVADAGSFDDSPVTGGCSCAVSARRPAAEAWQAGLWLSAALVLGLRARPTRARSASRDRRRACV